MALSSSTQPKATPPLGEDAAEAVRLVAGTLRRGESGEAFREHRQVLSWSASEAGLLSPASVEEGGTAIRIRRGRESTLIAREGDGPDSLRDLVREAAKRAGSSPFFKAARAVDRRVRPASTDPGLDEEEHAGSLAHALTHALPDPRGVTLSLTISRLVVTRAVITPRVFVPCGTTTRLQVLGTISRREGRRPFAFLSSRPWKEAVTAFGTALHEAMRPVPRIQPAEGETDVVLSPSAAAVFWHETVGHTLEREGTDHGASLLARVPDAVVGPPGLDVWDDPTRADLPGSYVADDEGVLGRPVALLLDGRVTGTLSDRRTGGAESNGHGRVSDFRRPPRARMSNLVVPAGEATLSELFERCGDGIHIREIAAGGADPESGRFFLAVERAEVIRKGKPASALLPFVLVSDVLTSLSNLDPARGATLEPASGLALCVKAGDAVPVGGLASAILLRGVHVRGMR